MTFHVTLAAMVIIVGISAVAGLLVGWGWRHSTRGRRYK